MSDISQEPFPRSVPAASAERGFRMFRRSFFLLFIVFLAGGVYWTGYQQGKSGRGASTDIQTLSPSEAIILNKDSADKTIDFSLFWKVWGLLKEKFVDRDKLDAHQLFYGAIKGMLAATGDPYTTFFDPEENKGFQEEISGSFEGIGAEMGMREGFLQIIAPLDDTPAQKAGLRAGDKILKISDQPVTNLTLDQAVGKIRGPKGTEVKLNIFRDGEEAPRDVAVRRDVISVKSVRFEMKEGDIALIRVSRFGDDTADGFRAAVSQAIKNKAQGLVIDLRNNPGGLLETTVVMASQMLPNGKTVVIEEDASGNRKEMKARGGDVLSGIPTVVLINEGSASASEILAGALSDNRDNVTLVGKKSFGKGSVQELIPVTSDTSVKITVAHWLTPSGKQINNVGIAPNVSVDLKADDIANNRDPQLDKAFEILKEKK